MISLQTKSASLQPSPMRYQPRFTSLQPAVTEFLPESTSLHPGTIRFKTASISFQPRPMEIKTASTSLETWMTEYKTKKISSKIKGIVHCLLVKSMINWVFKCRFIKHYRLTFCFLYQVNCPESFRDYINRHSSNIQNKFFALNFVLYLWLIMNGCLMFFKWTMNDRLKNFSIFSTYSRLMIVDRWIRRKIFFDRNTSHSEDCSY